MAPRKQLNLVRYERGMSTVIPPRRDGDSRISLRRITADSDTSTPISQGSPVPLSGPGRKLFTEDLSHPEMRRLEMKHGEWQHDIVPRYAGSPDPVDQHISQVFQTRRESFDQTAKRTLKEGTAWANDVRMPGDAAAPGAGWYYDQNEHYRTHSQPGVSAPNPDGANDPQVRQAIIGGSAMSPRNSPDRERASGEELSRNHLSQTKVTIPRNVATWINRQAKRTVVPEEHVLTPVDINDLHPDAIKALGSADRRAKFPRMDKDSPVNWKNVALGSPNVSKGIAGIRGATLDEVAPPLDAPKVNTYAQNNLDFQEAVPGQRKHYEDLVGASTGVPAAPVSKAVSMTPDLVDHVMKSLGYGMSSFNGNDRAVRQIQANAGRTVNIDHLHPAIVEALSSSEVRVSHPDVHHTALTSANHPIVADTWVHGAIAGQPQASVVPPGYLEARQSNTVAEESYQKALADHKVAMTGHREELKARKASGAEGSSPVAPEPPAKPVKDRRGQAPVQPKSVYKSAGSEQGYWTKKTLNSGEGILDVDRGNAAIREPALQHAANDHIVRRAAHLAPEVLGTAQTLPSVGVQESPLWTTPRRVAGKDPEYNAYLKSQR